MKVVSRGRVVGEMGKCWSKGEKLQLYQMNKSRDIMNSMEHYSGVSNTVLQTGNLQRVDFRYSNYRSEM